MTQLHRLQRAILILKLSIMVGVLSLIALTVIKERPQGEEWIVLNQNFVIVQVAVNGALLAALLGVYSAWGYRIAQSYRHGMTWTNRRAAVVRVRQSVCSCCLAPQFSAVYVASERGPPRWTGILSRHRLTYAYADVRVPVIMFECRCCYVWC